MKFHVVKLVSILPIIIAVNASSNTIHANVKLTYIKPEKANAQWVRAKQFTPRYPMKLAMQGVTGCGVFKVTVNESGKTEDVKVISSIPKTVIDKPAKKVIKSWQWKNVTDKTNVPEEKLIRLDFCMGGKTQAEALSRCEKQAKLAC